MIEGIEGIEGDSFRDPLSSEAAVQAPESPPEIGEDNMTCIRPHDPFARPEYATLFALGALATFRHDQRIRLPARDI